MNNEIEAFISGVTPAKRRRDTETLLAMYERVTGLPPKMWGTMIGFGEYHYRYDSGREGDAAAASFAPRKAAMSIYLPDGIETYAALLERLGKHRAAVGCLYLTDLELVDLEVLEQIVGASFAAVSAGGAL